MKYDKKGQALFMMSIVVFFISAMLSMFIGLMIYNIGQDFVMDPLYNASVTVGTQQGLSAVMMTNFDTLYAGYANLEFPFDLFFLLTLVSMMIMSVESAYMAKKNGVFSFFGYLTIGMMLFSLIMFFVSQFTDWFTDNFINSLFIANTPIFDFVFSNMAIISISWFAILLLINQLDFKMMIEQGGRFEE